MSDSNNPPSPPAQTRRRGSFVDMFSPRGANSTGAMSSSPPSAGVSATPAPPAQHKRGNSITALGLNINNSGNQNSPFNAFQRQRRASIATSSASSSPDFKNSFGDEPAVIEEDDSSRASINPPASPSFARRVSFGAQALRDVKMGGSPGASGGEGFNWSEAIRDRSKRSPSFSSGNPFAQGGTRPRSASISNPEPPKELPKAAQPPARMKKPDHLGERMLRGDFMMD